MEPVPLMNEPALTVDGSLVVADIHIGIEHELSLSGIHIPTQIQRRTDRILRYLEDTKADRVILLGDIKHNVPRTSTREREDIPHFLRSVPRTRNDRYCTWKPRLWACLFNSMG